MYTVCIYVYVYSTYIFQWFVHTNWDVICMYNVYNIKELYTRMYSDDDYDMQSHLRSINDLYIMYYSWHDRSCHHTSVIIGGQLSCFRELLTINWSTVLTYLEFTKGSKWANLQNDRQKLIIPQYFTQIVYINVF